MGQEQIRRLTVRAQGYDLEALRADAGEADLELRPLDLGRDPRWLRLALAVELATDDQLEDDEGWCDRLQVRWEVILRRGRPRPDPRLSVRFTRIVRYANVKVEADGRDYYVVILLPPEVVERYADDIDEDDILTRVAFYYRGEEVARFRSVGDDLLDADQRFDDNVRAWLAEDRPRRVEPGLLHRLETPWRQAGAIRDDLMRIWPE